MPRVISKPWIGIAATLLGILISLRGAADEKPALVDTLRRLDANVLDAERSDRERMLSEDSRARLREANRRETNAWRKIENREEWEAYRDDRIRLLAESVARFPKVPDPLPVKVTGELEGKGYRTLNVVFESRPGLWVTANLYQPEKPRESMPGIILCHSHHNPKTQGELQDMGVMWARAGCLVLVPDQLGHGERGQHGFRTAEDYDGSFRVSRQDYYFRHNLGLQLHLIGDSLIGWMAWDIMRGVDLLLSRPGIDPKRILLLGAVAGGGDPAAVTAALDPRISGVVPFNFGGPQPETGRLGADAEDAFNYAGSGSWESTRNLKDSSDGFLPWVIVGASAPRGLVYAHEFRWDRDRDPVWKRLNTIYGFYQAEEKLSSVHGFGTVRMSSGEASHCNNIGPVHRKGIHEAFQKWFEIPQPDEAFRERRAASELQCLNADVKTIPVHKIADELARERLNVVRRQLENLSAKDRRERLKALWSEKLGEVEPDFEIGESSLGTNNGIAIGKLTLKGKRGIRLPVLLLIPEQDPEENRKFPLVIFVAQAGKDKLLKERAEAIAALLEAGVAVCLPDLRGQGETRPGDGRSRQSWATSLSATELMLGRTLMGSRLKDLRSVLLYLRRRGDLDATRFAVWGDSLAAVNPANRNVNVPHGIGDMPEQAEPGGPMLALFAGLYEDDLAAVILARGGLVSWRSILESPFLYLPHDAVVPGALATSELSDIAAAIAPKPLWISGLVNGRNQAVSEVSAHAEFSQTKAAYRADKASGPFRLSAEPQSAEAKIVPWLVEVLKK